MSEKFVAALTALEKARATALEAAIADRVYRAAAVLDTEGQVQRGINKCQRLVNGKPVKPAKK